jgi:hypothetical protein
MTGFHQCQTIGASMIETDVSRAETKFFISEQLVIAFETIVSLPFTMVSMISVSSHEHLSGGLKSEELSLLSSMPEFEGDLFFVF